MPDNGAYAKLVKGFELLAEGFRLLDERGAKSTSPEVPEQEHITIDQIRYTMHTKCGEGKGDQVKELLLKYNGRKASDIKPNDYPHFFRELEVL